MLDRLGAEVPLHFTAFHPDFQMLDIPPTPPATLARAREIARRAGLRYVYTGNVADPEGQATLCPECGAPLIERTWHASRVVRARERVLPPVRDGDRGGVVESVLRASETDARTDGATTRCHPEPSAAI